MRARDLAGGFFAGGNQVEIKVIDAITSLVVQDFTVEDEAVLAQAVNNALFQITIRAIGAAATERTVNVHVSDATLSINHTDIWWIGGREDVPGYYNRATLTAPGSGSYSWDIPLGSNKLEILSTTGNTCVVRSSWSSETPGDVQVRATQDTHVYTINLTVRAPTYLTLKQIWDTPAGIHGPGIYETDVIYELRDQFYAIPKPPIFVAEFWDGPPVSDRADGKTWPRPPPQGRSLWPRNVADSIGMKEGPPPVLDPPSVRFEEPGFDENVDHWSGSLGAGGDNTFGVSLYNLPSPVGPVWAHNPSVTWKRYRGKGRHE